jgi:multidrug efflux pump subunit AcrB
MFNLIKESLRKPISVLVAMMAIVFFSVLAVQKMSIDIFPNLSLPTVYVAQPYGGMSPQQVEALITSYYEYHFLYITGIKYVESKSIQGVSLLKLEFYDGTDMSQAVAEVVGYVNRSRAFMPPGTVGPFITRFDAGSVPVGQLVFKSESRTLGEIQDLALFKVRPLFSTLPGVSAPPPFGGNQKTVIIKADPERMRSYGIAPDELISALAKGNTISPAGNLRVGEQTLITPQNTMVDNIQELGNIAVRNGSGTNIYVRDLAKIELGSDITTGYALINGKRSVYLNVSKRSDASTWSVVQAVKKALPDMQAAVPDDIKVSYEFDQSDYVINSLKNLLFEGGLGAILTGLMVWLFLGDSRSALIVVLTIPISLLAGLIGLYVTGQTLNVMTLGGLALAVGILVDESTVTIENIHRHLEMGKSKPQAVFDASREIALPKLLILLCILAVFVPAFFMSGVPKAMFVPMSLAVGFSMIASFLLSQTFVPVVANYLMKDHFKSQNDNNFQKVKNQFDGLTIRILNKKKIAASFYVLFSLLTAVFFFIILGTEIFPSNATGQMQVRLRMPTGTRIERTEDATQKVLKIVDRIAGAENIDITSAFVGTQPSSYPINTIYLWTSGPHEAVLKIKPKTGSGVIREDFKEQLREAVKKEIPELRISFEAGDLTEQIMNLGANTPVEIAVVGKNIIEGQAVAEKIKEKLAEVSFFRDVQIISPIDYPAMQISIDRVRAGQLGLTSDDIGKSLTAATSSSRFVQPNYWIDQKAGNAYQVQVEVPQYLMKNPEDVEQIEVGKNVTFREVADWKRVKTIGEYDRLNQQRYVTITANIFEKDLGNAISEVEDIKNNIGEIPKGLKIIVRGQADLLSQTMDELKKGLLLAIAVIFLMLAANFQSFRLSFVVLSSIPTVVAGSLVLLFIFNQTLNIQSFMGIIMAIGVSVANAILFITNAENIRQYDINAATSTGISQRLRPILMTSLAMIAGMIPMALGLGDSGDQTAPLGIAVIGGLLFSTFGSLLGLPAVYQWAVGNKMPKSVSLLPEEIIN